MYWKSWSYDVRFLRYRVRTEWDRQNSLSFWATFCPFTPLMTQKIKFSKTKKNPWRYYHFTHVYHKWQSYDAWFLRYGVRQNFLSFWAIFCPFTSLRSGNSKFWKNEKSNRRYYPFTHMHHNWQSHDVWFLRHGAQQTNFCHFGPFFGLLPHYQLEKSNFGKK